MPAKPSVSLDDMVAKKRATEKAQAIFGRKHKYDASAAKKGFSGSGSGFGAGANGKWSHDLHHKNNPSASRVSKLPMKLAPSVARNLQKNRLFAALHGDQANVIPAPAPASRSSPPSGPKSMAVRSTARPAAMRNNGSSGGSGGTGLAIRGSAGPAVVLAQNFAPGTSAEDVQQAMAGCGAILSCRALQTHPTVQCELIFEKREGAELCVQQFNQQVADGRRITVYIKQGPPPTAPKLDRMYTNHTIDPDQQRKEADRARREANLSFQDGRYGVKPPPLYSDALLQKGRGFSR